MLTLVGKNMIKECTEKVVTTVGGDLVSAGLAKLKEQTIIWLQGTTSGMLTSREVTNQCCRRIVVMSKLNKSKIKLKDEVEKALAPQESTTNEWLSALGQIGRKWLEKQGSGYELLLQGADIIGSLHQLTHTFVTYVPKI